MSDLLTMYKATRHDGTDFYSGTVNYAAALASGQPLEIDADPPTGNVCGRGLHVCDHPHKTCRFVNSAHRPYRWFEVLVAPSAVVEQDEVKLRVSRIEKVVRELTLDDLFGPDFAARIQQVRDEVATWKSISWLKPARLVTDAELADLVRQWLAAISPWRRDKGYELPATLKVVRTAAAAAAAAAVADADAAAAAVVAADAVAVVAADADALRNLPWWWRWYGQPRYILRRMARWQLAGLKQPNPWTPLVAIYRLGCLPIGYCRIDGQVAFMVYAPEPKGGA